MAKLQMIKRANGTESYSSNIPIRLINELGWEKGDNLCPEIKNSDGKIVLVIRKGLIDG